MRGDVVRTETQPISAAADGLMVDAPKRTPAGFGLPCAKCHKYFSADLEVCPVCKARERVSPDVAPKTPLPQELRGGAEPVPRNLALIQEEKEYSQQQLGSFTYMAHAESNPEVHSLSQRESVGSPPITEVGASTDVVTDNVARAQEEEFPQRLESPMITTPVEVHAENHREDHPLDQDASAATGKACNDLPSQDINVGGPAVLRVDLRNLTGGPDGSPQTMQTEEFEAAEPENSKSDTSAVACASETSKPTRSRLFDILTIALGAVVLACVVLMCALVGLRLMPNWTTAEPAHRSGSPQQSAASPEAAAPPSHAGTTSHSSPADSSAATAHPETSAAAPQTNGVPTNQNAKQTPRPLPSLSNGKENRDAQNKNASETEHSPSAVPERPVTLSQDVAESMLLNRVEPEYPDDARQQGMQGAVVLDLRVGKNGAVQDVVLVSGQPLLAEAAIAAVKQWRFQPQTVNGKAVEMQTRIALRFALHTS